MSKIDPNKIRKNGVVLKQTCGFYKVKLENGIEILTTIAAKFRVPHPKIKKLIRPRVFEQDKVIVEIPLNQSKLERGTIVGFSKL